MFGKKIKLFDLYGFSVGIDWSWFIIVLLVTWSLAASLFLRFYEGLATPTYWAMGVTGALGLFVSIVLHEFGHAMVACRNGLPMRGITLFIFGGVAEMTDEPPNPKVELKVAVAGPIVSILIALACFGVYRLAQPLGWHASVVGVMWYLWMINIVLVAFNIAPAFPLDGGRVLRSAIWHLKGNLKSATRITSEIGAGFGLFLILLGVLSLFVVNLVVGLWWMLIGMFLRGGAHASYQQLLVRRALEGESVRQFMNDEPITVPPDATVAQLVEDYIYTYHHKMYPVTRNGNVAGCVTTRQVKMLSREHWGEMTVGELAEPCDDQNTIAPDADAMDAYTKLNRSGASRLMVVDNRVLRGILSLKDLMKFFSLKVELEQS